MQNVKLSPHNKIGLFYSRMERKIELDADIKACRLCPGLNVRKTTESAPGYGNVLSSIMFVGQSLCTKCMMTQIPFTRGSGDILDEVFISLGKMKYDYFITNVVHCHPPGNRASSAEEIGNCAKFLRAEIKLIKPKLVIALGKDAQHAIYKQGAEFSTVEFMEYKTHLFGIELYTIWCKHPAYWLHKPDKKAKQKYQDTLRGVLQDERFG